MHGLQNTGSQDVRDLVLSLSFKSVLGEGTWGGQQMPTPCTFLLPACLSLSHLIGIGSSGVSSCMKIRHSNKGFGGRGRKSVRSALSPFYRGGHRYSEQFGNLSKAPQLVNGRAQMVVQGFELLKQGSKLEDPLL